MAAQDIPREFIFDLLKKLRAEKPLVQCITNFVSMDLMANALLAIGASPAMVHCAEEAADFQAIASALLVNVGTLSPDWVAGMELAINKANELKKPWVLDPVAAGATPFRTRTILKLAKMKPWVIRGNASEIMALAGAAGSTRGIDSTAQSSEALEMGKQLARDLGTIIAISGETDYVTDGERVLEVSSGVAMLQQITASGCAVTALIAAFVACALKEPLLAAAHALSAFGIAVERAEDTLKATSARFSVGPGSLRVGLIDELYFLHKKDREDDVGLATERIKTMQVMPRGAVH